MAPDEKLSEAQATPEGAADTPAPTLEEEVAALRAALAAESDRRLRSLAETENLKKRLLKEKEEFQKYATESLVAELVPVLDHLDLALAHGRGNDACKDFVVGVDMTRKAFLDILGRHGVAEFGRTGEPFNPETHEALGMASLPDLPADTVAQVVQKGYTLRGRLLRPAKVMVNKI
ncbi:GrpE protein [Solidesulfovibrio carbinoliphilus subsp. oakridgensis]|uniref:Protein GrpE n=1 Tax=Solidesulfovibrio carbinoliphilus subsp. oakridgensis TaxID=694327 RepID=G7QBR5_9BACT|nr:nucleotide exchange factor GrpE [Solidesulfovibrio carbinoliphilus]EHJ49408.1 GrpE protein [Solidesulfovibrio carbinoliphilus subsp. oakridgensis]